MSCNDESSGFINSLRPEIRSLPRYNSGLSAEYVRARYGVNLWQASPVDALRTTTTPVLLIHGTADTNIVLHHSRELHAINPTHTELWEVHGAGHVASLGTSRQEYIRRVTSWLEK